MISKELVSAVLGYEIAEILPFNKDENFIEYTKFPISTDAGIWEDLNIYELAHKCKEWANKQGILLRSSIDGVVDFYDFRINGEDKGEFIDCREFKCSEVKAVIQACQWILDNVKTDSLS